MRRAVGVTLPPASLAAPRPAWPGPTPPSLTKPGESPTMILRSVLAEPHRPGSDLSKLAYLVRCAVDALVKDAAAGELRLSDLGPVFSRLDGAPLLGMDATEVRERLARLDSLRETATRGAESARAFSRLKSMGQLS
jgi:hypothetical protein